MSKRAGKFELFETLKAEEVEQIFANFDSTVELFLGIGVIT